MVSGTFVSSSTVCRSATPRLRQQQRTEALAATAARPRELPLWRQQPAAQRGRRLQAPPRCGAEPEPAASEFSLPRPRKAAQLEPSYWLGREGSVEAQLKVSGTGSSSSGGAAGCNVRARPTRPACRPALMCRRYRTTIFRTAMPASRRCTALPASTPFRAAPISQTSA